MNKKVKIAIGLIMALVVVGIIVFVVKETFFDKFDSVITIYDEEKNESTLYINGKMIGNVEGEASIVNNLNNSAYYLISDVAAYFVNGKKIEKVGEKLELVNIANYSSEALFLDESFELYLYKNGELISITEEDINYAVISGDGKTYAYSTDEAAYFGNEVGNETKVEDVIISHISHKGEYIYALKYDEDGIKAINSYFGSYYFGAFTNQGYYSPAMFDLLSINSDGSCDLIAKDVYYINGLNADGNELVYYREEGSYITVDCKNTNKISDKYIYSFYYNHDEYMSNNDYLSVDSFKNAICEIGDYKDKDGVKSICKLSKKYEAEVLTDDSVMFVSINDKMSKVFYIDSEKNLCRIETKTSAKSELLAKDVDLVRVSPDGTDIYFTRQDSEEITVLYHIEYNRSEKQLAIVYDFFDIIVYDKYCYLEADKIYYIKNDKMTEMTELSDLECFFIDYASQSVYGYTEDKVYKINGDKVKELEGDYKLISNYDYVY